MINKEQAKEKLKNLVKDFKNNPDYYKKLSEADVEDKLVNELFVNILGWDKKDYEKRAKARRGDKGGSADYAFKINNQIVFFLEVKKVTIPLDKEADEQVILYSLSKKVPLAISTNFQQMNIFCVEQENAIQNVFRNFKTPDDYVDNFQDLLFLSKESFEQGLLLKKAEDEGRLKRRVSIDKVLLEDFWRVRTLIANDIEKNKPGKYNLNEKDEIVQRILDRLIFIRRCEDIGINPENLTLEEIKHVAESRAYSQLKALFTKYDLVYNSGLFTPNKDNDCDIITIDGSIIQKLISYLYESHDKKYKYNFEWIDADVLGQVYEQYLGKILAQTKSGKAKLKGGQAHRKEQGIYYTPTYIVDYIIKNTLGELLKDKKIDTRNIKILDPACGSGSFLIKAFDYLNEHLSKDEKTKQHKLDFQGPYSVKTEILKNNIFGVDLDNKAVEITKLNLLLKAAEKFRKLPSELDNHIGWGNSLIDDDSFEHPFKWIGDFQEGTFDVVIGNPPYVRVDTLDEKEKVFWKEKFVSAQGKYDLYYLFVEKVIGSLKEGGLLGFIIPNKFCAASSAKNLREFLVSNSEYCNIISVSHLDVFKDASNYPVILIIKKGKRLKKFEVGFVTNENMLLSKSFISYTINKEVFEILPSKIFPINVSRKQFELVIKLIKNNEKIIQHLKISEGLRIPPNLEDKSKTDFKILKQYQFEKWGDIREGSFISKKNISKVISNTSERYKNILKDKVIIAEDALTITATLDYERMIPQGGVYFGVLLNNKMNIKYTLGLLNSALLSFVYKILYGGMHMGGGYLRYRTEFLEQLPIKIVSESQQQPIINLVDRMLSLNKQLQEIGDKKTAQTAKLEEEIKKTDEEINDLVYKLYGITEEEKKIIEESLE